MAAVGQIYYNIIDPSNENKGFSSSVDTIYEDLVNKMGARFFTKLGIQAPPGTKVLMGGETKGEYTKTIMVGRTGSYELDDEIKIGVMKFVQPLNYIKDEFKSNTEKTEGMNGMISANNTRQSKMNSLAIRYPTTPTDEFLPNGTPNPIYREYWKEYDQIQQEYIRDYTAALNKFNRGSNGIYTLPNPDNLNDPINKGELYNIIIDFIYE